MFVLKNIESEKLESLQDRLHTFSSVIDVSKVETPLYFNF